MASDTAQEKTEQATPKRLREAREKGQIPRSKELNSLALLLAASGGLLVMGETIITDIKEIMYQGLALESARSMDTSMIVENFSNAVLQGLTAITPLFVVLIAIVIMTPVGLGGWSFSTKSISFRWEKLDPIKGFGRIYAWRSIMELLKVLVKFVLVAVTSGFIIWSLIDEILGLGNEPLPTALSHLANLCGWLFLASSSVLIAVAAIDVPFQLWQHAKELRMTKQEVKDESKETDGRPEVKSRIRALQQELSQRRMMEAVPDADVVITNPTHYAIALRYDMENMHAPVVVAKGADHVAACIREVAVANNVTIVSAPPLARALYANTLLNQEIPAGLYVAVANILSYVYQLAAAMKQGDDLPVMPTDIPIPDDLEEVIDEHVSDSNAGS